MSIFHIEKMLEFFRSDSEDAIIEVGDYKLNTSNAKRAQSIAQLLDGKTNLYKHGPMWAEIHIPFPDGRYAWLQASRNSFIIDFISPDTKHPIDLSARFDRTHKTIVSFHTPNPNDQNQSIFYEAARHDDGTPIYYTPIYIAQNYSVALYKVEQAINRGSQFNLFPAQKEM